MDPNATLYEIEDRLRLLQSACHDLDRDTAIAAAADLAEFARALEEWLDRGGVLPTVLKAVP